MFLILELAFQAAAWEFDELDYEAGREAQACWEEAVYLDRDAELAALVEFSFEVHRDVHGKLYAVPCYGFTYVDRGEHLTNVANAAFGA